MDIQLFNETKLDIPVTAELISSLAERISREENCSFAFLEVVYVDEKEIVRINSEHLKRNYITDVITFRYDENEDRRNIEGTIFCCAPRIEEQAAEFGQKTGTEYVRILIHGMLHLAGYEDQSETEKEKMTSRENHYLKSLSDSL